MCNPGVVSETLTCFYASAAVNWLRIKLTNLRRHALRMNPGCTKPSTLGVIILRILLLPGWIFHSIVYHLFQMIVYQEFSPKFTTLSAV